MTLESERTARMVARFRSLLDKALQEKDDMMAKQYFNGLVYAKSEHITALEKDLALAKLELRKVG
jgi:hypothetical protein